MATHEKSYSEWTIYTQFRFGGYDFHKVYKITFAEYIRRKSLSRTITQVIYRKYLILTSFDNMLDHLISV